MDFFIRRNANLPILLMKLTDDSRIDYQEFNKMLENSSITFSMVDENGTYKIANKAGGIINKPKISKEETNFDEYYIYYRFNEEDTSVPGKYRAEFVIEFFSVPGVEDFKVGKLKVPIKEDLFVHVLDSFAKTEIRYVTR